MFTIENLGDGNCLCSRASHCLIVVHSYIEKCLGGAPGLIPSSLCILMPSVHWINLGSTTVLVTKQVKLHTIRLVDQRQVD